ncbi:MAG: hypothetical protein QOF76_4076 [Solirubrobacteraceae bacterium]|jgi:poly-gamma-glutamate synthesis protein (capsule biosynthesis protein)|nr:hypothetical protein [Solirubrobacteraceae bacterium]
MRRFVVLSLGLLLLTPTAATARPTRLTIEADGDLLIHSPVWLAARALAGGHGYRFSPLFRRVRPFIENADLALCHVETPMTAAPPTGYPVFNTPPALARAIKRTGWDACSTASNHTLDRGAHGVAGTIAALHANGIPHAGSATSARGARRITMLEAKGVKVAFLAYTQILNAPVPAGEPWLVNVASAARIRRDAARATRHGAQVVIVNLHWGNEYVHAPSPAQHQLVAQVARSKNITAIVGQHVHVVQPIRRHNGRTIVYGEGNLISNQTAACCPAGSQDGYLAILHLQIDRTAHVKRVTYVPTYVSHPSYTVLPVKRALHNGWGNRAELQASLRRTTAVVGNGPKLAVA